ncbi:MAG: helix-turn-helix domain-containing protein, partial [Solirubrobacteraceae bacterium]|nr:helix-turn-helix domain-containing protein [Solirubrobacteraceae bacterium]
WEWANGITSTVARLHGDLEEQRLRRERSRRTEFVRTLLLGTHPGDRLRANASRFGLALDRPYVPFCSRPTSRRDALDIASTILRTGADGGLSPVVETLDGDLVGLSPTLPQVDGHLVAVGEPMVIDQVHQSFADACAALDAAHAFEMSGTFMLEDLGPRPLVVTAERAAERLDRRVLAPFPDDPEPNEIERTVLDYLNHDQDAEGTARRMCVHVNTVRYRVGRFRELTGLDLRRTEDLVAAWWLLNRRAANRRQDVSGPRAT